VKFDLIRPCKHCPFNNVPERIIFRTRERAEEIEEHGYRNGFVCHEHGESDDDSEDGGIDFRADGSSQHCVGLLYMHLQQGTGTIPWERGIEDGTIDENRWWDRADLKALGTVFETETEFLDANGDEQ